MSRFKRAGLAIALVALLPVSAQALGFSVSSVTSSNGPTNAIENGSIVTVEVVLENTGNLDVFGLGFGLRGTDSDADGIENSGLVFQSVLVASPILASAVDPGTGQPLNGLVNVLGAPVVHGNSHFLPQLDEEVGYTLFNSISLTAANGDGALDWGVDSTPVGGGDVHIRVQFLAVTGLLPSTLNLEFGVIDEFGHAAIGTGGSVLAFSSGLVSVTVIPEPGTALLMGLGLAGMASTRRRR